ncbi:hypothetical protein [Helicobacter suis]|uniref:hypothetical protein n=1 Tax=Helicobacter suis TaxID=104628 RepID=UPI0013D1EAAE|nr:hypothetical protein [Helicobacter suis]
MKILSSLADLEGNNLKDILMPCYLYPVWLRVQSNSFALNLIERTALRLKEVKVSNDKLAKMLGLVGNGLDLSEILPKILEKITQNNPGLKEVEEIEETKLVYFLQDSLSGKVLEKVFATEPQTILPSHIGKQVFFKSGQEEVKAYIIKDKSQEKDKPEKDKPQEKPHDPTPQQLKIALKRHNEYHPQERLEGEPKEVSNRVFIYLHCKLNVLSNAEFNISDGFGGSSYVLYKSFEENAPDNLKEDLRNQYKTEIKAHQQIQETPFVKPTKYDSAIKSIESKFKNNPKTACADLFSLCENILKDFAKVQGDIRIEIVEQNAQEMGFELEEEVLSWLHGKEELNIQLHLKYLLQEQDQKLVKIASKYPHFIHSLRELNLYRNLTSHGGKAGQDDRLKTLDPAKITGWRDQAYTLVEVFLDNPRKENIPEIHDDTEYHQQNAAIEARNQFSRLWDRLEKETKNELINVYFYLNVDIQSYQGIAHKEVVGNLYMLFERVFRDLNGENSPTECPKATLTAKLPIGCKALKEVRQDYLTKAFLGRLASLGAYFLVFLSYANPTEEQIWLINNLVDYRRHNNEINPALARLSSEDLKDLAQEALEYLKNLIGEMA